jgi:hypothetical protein
LTINRRCLSFFVVFMVFSAVAFVPLVSATEAEAASAIAVAKQRMVVCFQAAEDAELAGANITSLANVLNDAGALLSDAELAFSYGDFDLAQSLAVESFEGLNNFVSEANELHDAAVQAGTFDFYVFVGSAVGAFLVILVGVAVWFWARTRFSPSAERI